jgi:mannose-1-phosphate guanylyltransferase
VGGQEFAKMTDVYAIIMAGGRGERFWPLSTDQLTKPFVPLLGPKSLIQETVDRLHPLIPKDRILISIGKAHEAVARAQLPTIPPGNFIIEPIGRDTSACLGFCALHLEKRNPDSILLAVPADHFVENPEAYRRTLARGIENLPGTNGIVFGIAPERPETGYGYIQAEKPADSSAAWPVTRFVEKPDAVKAAAYIKSGTYFWNSGIFLWHNKALLELFRMHMPQTHQRLCELRPLLAKRDTDAQIFKIFSSIERISIDFGIMEKAGGFGLIPAEFQWDDVGSWAALARALPADENKNIFQGSHAAVDANGCIVYSDAGLVAIFGTSDLVVVQAKGKVLVCPKDRASGLKELVRALDKPLETK